MELGVIFVTRWCLLAVGLASLTVHGQTESRLEIRCFGQFEVLRGGVAVQRWRRDHARALLKHLVVQGRPVPRESILTWLWPDASTEVRSGYLRVVLHALRQAIGTWNGSDYVRLEGDRLLVDPGAPVWIDADAFMAHLRTAEILVRHGRMAEALNEYLEAEAIYRGDYLLEDVLEPWTLLRREELKDRYQVMLTRVADYYLNIGDFVGTIERCHKLLTQDPCREDVYQRLMYCHAALGQRSRAVRWYEMCRTTMLSELGHEPGKDTRDLHDHIASSAGGGPNQVWTRQDPRVMVDGQNA